MTVPETLDTFKTRKSDEFSVGEEKDVLVDPVCVAVNADDNIVVPDEFRLAAVLFSKFSVIELPPEPKIVAVTDVIVIPIPS